MSSLLADPGIYDQHVVTIVGEIVGDYGERGDVIWVQVNDDPYVDRPLAQWGRLAGGNNGISVRLEDVSLEDFGPPGGHGVRGPVVQVTGVFHHIDPERGGLIFIEAADVVLVDASVAIPADEMNVASLVIGAILTTAGLLTMAHRRDLLPKRPERA